MCFKNNILHLNNDGKQLYSKDIRLTWPSCALTVPYPCFFCFFIFNMNFSMYVIKTDQIDPRSCLFLLDCGDRFYRRTSLFTPAVCHNDIRSIRGHRSSIRPCKLHKRCFSLLWLHAMFFFFFLQRQCSVLLLWLLVVVVGEGSPMNQTDQRLSLPWSAFQPSSNARLTHAVSNFHSCADIQQSASTSRIPASKRLERKSKISPSHGTVECHRGATFSSAE